MTNGGISNDVIRVGLNV